MSGMTMGSIRMLIKSILASATRYKPNLSVTDPEDPRYVAGDLPLDRVPNIPAEKVTGLGAVAYSNDFNDLDNQPEPPTDTVKYTEQSLTDEQKAQARANIGASDGSELPSGGAPYKQLVTDASGKTVWEDRPYKNVTEETLFEPKSVALTSSYYNQRQYNTGESVALVDGNTYIVDFNGTKYECVAHVEEQANNVENGVIIGEYNTGVDNDSKDIPFYGFNDDGALWFYVHNSAVPEGDTCTFGVVHKIVDIKTIDPDLIGGWKALGEGEPVKTALVDNVTFTLSSYGNFGGAYNPFEVAVEQGKEYTVVWGADEYTVIGTTSDTVDGVYIGNLGIMSPDVADTGEPFCIVAMDGVTQVISKTIGEQTVSVYAMVPELIMIPDEYVVYQFPEKIKNSEHAEAVIAEMQKHSLVRVGDTVCVYSFYEGNDGVVFKPVIEPLASYNAGMLVTSVADNYPMDTSYLQTSWKQYGTALYLSTPSGKKFAIKVSDDGTLSATEVT